MPKIKTKRGEGNPRRVEENPRENPPLKSQVTHQIMAITLSRPFIFMSPRIMNNCNWSGRKLNVRDAQK